MSKQMTESGFEEIYNDMLDEVYGTLKICGLEYSCSRTLREIDPIAYREGLLNYADSEGIELI